MENSTNLKKDDIILKIDGVQVKNMKEFVAEFRRAFSAGANAMNALIKRGSEELEVTIEFEQETSTPPGVHANH